MPAYRLILGLAIAIALSGALASGALADESKADEGQTADNAADKKKPDATQPATKDDDSAKAEKSETKDPYAVPEGGVKELLAFINSVQQIRPKTAVEARTHSMKMIVAIKAAAEKIKSIATEEDKKLPGYDDAMAMELAIRTQNVAKLSAEERKSLLDEIKAALNASPTPSQLAVVAGNTYAIQLEYNRQTELAAQTYRELGALLAKSSDPNTAKNGARMEGAARRLELLGKPLELSGTLMDGEKFDWAKYRGKVVLVDFWATWCGPCRAELPNVKKNYEAYHSRGFDVVGVSLDRDREALEQFLEKEKNPWPTIHDGDWEENSVAAHYGIMGIPTVFLVDKEGKVVSTKARGPELGKQLAILLGPPDDKPDQSTSEKPADAAK